jgi:hypothetical protein
MTTDEPPSQTEQHRRRSGSGDPDCRPTRRGSTIEQSHTGILTTVAPRGMPISLPVWFVNPRA